MPPQRTIPPAKAIKTERTHEENQERAYIAASRRSDRSLEARVESARRASEIHKRRTGRSLRVTEQDVVNEEMYEEEDDDLPMQYRRLTAHLQTGSADFNRRLAAYLTNHVAMRSALDQAITNSYAQQYPNAPQFAHNQQNMYPSPFMPQSGPQSLGPQSIGPQSIGPQSVGPQSIGPQSIGPQSLGPQSLQPQVLQQQQPSHQSQQSSHSYRQAPYQIPRTPSYRPGVHARSATVATPHNSTAQAQGVPMSSPVEGQSESNQRRMSMPTPAPSAPVSPVNVRPSQQVPSYSTNHDNQTSHPSPPIQPLQQMSAPPQPQSLMASVSRSAHDLGPLTTSLPMESQYLLGPALDSSNPFTSMLMSGSDSLMQSYYSPSSMSPFPKLKGFNSPNNGMNCTLAPSALDMSPDHHPEPLSAATDYATNPIFGQDFESAYPDIFKGSAFRASSSGHGSGNVTPGHGRMTPGLDSWDAFINDSSWSENTT